MNRTGLGVVLLAMGAVACDSATDQDQEALPQSATTAAVLSGEELLEETLTVETASVGDGAESTGGAQVTAAEPQPQPQSQPQQEPQNHDSASDAQTTTPDTTSAPVTSAENVNAGNTSEPAYTNAPATTVETGSSSEAEASASTSVESSTTVESSTSDSSSSSGGNGASASTSSSASLTVGGTYDSTLSVVADAGNHQCSQVGDIVDLQVSGVLLDHPLEFSSIDITSQALLDLQAHANLQVVSHGDKNLSVRVTSPDILDLVFSYENQLDMIYISAVSPNTAKPVILKKIHSVERCSYALYTDAGCAVVASDIGLMSASVDNVSITADGCKLDNPAGIPVIEIED